MTGSELCWVLSRQSPWSSEHEEGLHTVLIVCDAKKAAVVRVTVACHGLQQVRSSASVGAPHEAEAQQLPPVCILQAHPDTLALEAPTCGGRNSGQLVHRQDTVIKTPYTIFLGRVTHRYGINRCRHNSDASVHSHTTAFQVIASGPAARQGRTDVRQSQDVLNRSLMSDYVMTLALPPRGRQGARRPPGAPWRA